MQTEAGFLRAILDQPAADVPLLAYADWLEEQGDAVSLVKAKFLRLTVSAGVQDFQLQSLAETLDTDWLAIVSRLPIENCNGRRLDSDRQEMLKQVLGSFIKKRCNQRWELLTETDDSSVRYCNQCDRSVYYCDTIVTARNHAARGRCLAIDLGIQRKTGDSTPSGGIVGWPSEESRRAEAARLLLDPVSARARAAQNGPYRNTSQYRGRPMNSEAGFLRAILDQPAGNATPLVYADWLEQQGDAVSLAKAEFLRLSAITPASASRTRGRVALQRARLQELATTLNTDWLAVVSRLRVENCRSNRSEQELSMGSEFRFDYICDRSWELMEPTPEQTVRHCQGCDTNVYYCATIVEARQHAHAQHCIAIDLGIPRRDRDWHGPELVAGWPSEAFYRAEDERLKPDAVSVERERRKAARGEAPSATEGAP